MASATAASCRHRMKIRARQLGLCSSCILQERHAMLQQSIMGSARIAMR